MFLTAQLVITIFLLAAEKHKGTFLAPIGIGLSLFIAELSGVYFTGGEFANLIRIASSRSQAYNLRFSQSCPILWTMRGSAPIPRLPLEVRNLVKTSFFVLNLLIWFAVCPT